VIVSVYGDTAPGAAVTQADLAQPTPAPTPGEDYGKSSPIALVLILLLGVALVLLIRSMSKHLRKVPDSFDDPGPGRRVRPRRRKDAGDEAS
jgi:hypothetical protein